MSKLEELIARLCPNGVEYKALTDVVRINRGVRLVKKQLKDVGDYPVYQNSSIPLGYYDDYNCEANTTMVISAGAAGDILFSNKKFWAADDCFYFISSGIIDNKFLYYFLMTQQKDIRSKVRKASIPRLPRIVLEKLKLPVPPLEVQREIVHILDSFTFLTAELAAELAARQKQYLAYATKLIEESNSEKILVADLGSFTYGYTATALDKGNTRIVRITDIDDQGCLKEDNAKFINMNDVARKSLLKKGDLVMARTGATYGKTLYFDSEYPSVYASFLIKLTLNNQKILNRFYWHFSKTSLYWQQAEKLVTVGGQQQFNTPALKKILVPVPPLSEQQRIVDILDRFDALCNDITSGLPAEIEARKKQYEYYRDKLLTFKELKKEA